MNNLYRFPKSAAFGRVLPKNKIFENTTPTAALRELFVREVEQIVWAYKLSPETINLPSRQGIQEIQVFTITLKKGTLKNEVLQCIDKAIPSPIFFQLTFDNKIQYVAAYKRPNETDTNKWVTSEYFKSEWTKQESKQIPLPVVLDLAALYQLLLQRLIPVPVRSGEKTGELVVRAENIRKLERDVEAMTSRVHKERQFNRQVELNAQLRELKQELEELSRIAIDSINTEREINGKTENAQS
jgi:hypothetical protein